MRILRHPPIKKLTPISDGEITPPPSPMGGAGGGQTPPTTTTTTPPKYLALAAGNFDGCHLGHRALLLETQKQAEKAKLQSAALTFEPHPLSVLRPDAEVRRLGGAREKIRQIAECGTEFLFLAKFTKETAATPAEEFARSLFNILRARIIVVGENFRFGKERKGDCEMLRTIAKQCGAEIVAAPLLAIHGAPISSGRIRACVEEGRFEEAAKLLGREWQISGRIVRGRGMGAALGFPTANLRAGFIPPCRGVFAGWAEWKNNDNDGGNGNNDNGNSGNNRHPAAISIGVNPTVQKCAATSIEAHLPGFSGDLYGKRLTLTLRKKLREEKQYPDAQKLKTAIAADIKTTVALLRKN